MADENNGPCGTFKCKDVPDAEVENVMAYYRLDNPISVTKEDQGGGLWTVVAVFPPCGDGEEQVNETTHSGNG
ncbi:MAG TPA: hypothetical protein VF688_10315 [Allosphingosinicella sp.]|jgi:hypothetical protein